MSTPTPPSSGCVFISYRRQETAPYARLLREELGRHLGAERVFMDVDSIEVGVDFAEAIQHAVDACEVLLALVGPQWLTITDTDGQRRLDDPDDTARLEIAAALERNIRVIPILVDNTPMPRHQQLPDNLVPLAHRNALEMTNNRYGYDLERLLEADEKVIGRPAAPTASRTSPALGQEQQTAAERPAVARTTRARKTQAQPEVLAEVGDLDQARSVVDQALATAETIPDAVTKVIRLADVAVVLVQTGQTDQALSIARQIQNVFWGDWALVEVAKALAQAGDLDQALATVQAIPDDDNRPRALAAVAEGLAQAGDLDQALTTAKTIPDDFYSTEALIRVARVLAQSGP